MIPWWVAAIAFVAGANLGLFTFALLAAASRDREGHNGGPSGLEGSPTPTVPAKSAEALSAAPCNGEVSNRGWDVPPAWYQKL